eukprot:CAMPEP_0198248552 /NCGR_PEP_ID=MMETSP1447-20131203/304_1 /TAXON_ID=420782 /ORGANISM="Chaetoceros dichaeta, Strain CCMP1751" /LENGTH=648 /DNA_ID=CAMNT_0043932981 /DNA_START=44 /DNA_END=1990 /DNA_ORIENTATION=-
MQQSPFVTSMDKVNHLTLGENGSAEYSATGVQESRVALFFALVRDLSKERLKEFIHLVLNDASEDKPEIVADLFILAFQTRNCRGGKGEKDLFYKIIIELVMIYPQTVQAILHLIPHYGSFQDWFKIISLATDNITDAKVKLALAPTVNIIMDLASEQLRKDENILDEISSSDDKKKLASSGISLLAKWAPREKKQFKTQAQVLANKLFPDSKAPKKEYRQLISRLNTAIRTPEIAMSANKWDSIDFSSQVSSNCLMKNRKAFLNETVGGTPPQGDDLESGNRHTTNASRIQCRKRLRDAMLNTKAKKLKGRQLFPHEIVQKIQQNPYQLSTLEKDMFGCQWQDIKSSLLTTTTFKEKSSHAIDSKIKRAVDLGQVVPIVDVSGSMNGIPMEVAIALGILVSEVASPAFANRCLTFHSEPSWVEFDPKSTLYDKVMKISAAPWGMNTDFEKATEKILEVAIKAKLKPDEIPDLIVFSDMQFDHANGQYSSGCHSYNPYSYEQPSSVDRWEPQHKRIVRRFKEEGMKACGKEWPAPHITYWNLRGSTCGFPAQGDTPNVTMLSGYSPSLLKLLLDGEPLEEEEVEELDENGSIVKAKKNPFTAVRKALDDEDYDKVRKILSDSDEGLLQFYKAPLNAPVDSSKGDWEVL